MSFTTELTDLSGVSRGMLEPRGLSVHRKLCGGIDCQFKLLTTDALAPDVRIAERAVRVWDDTALRFMGKIRDPLVRKAGELTVNCASPFSLLDRRQLQAETIYTATDQGDILNDVLGDQNARSETHLRMAVYAASRSRDRSYDAGKQVREIFEQLSGVQYGPWFLEVPTPGLGAAYTQIQLRYPPPPTPVTKTATFVNGSAIITLPDVVGLVVGMTVASVPGMPGERRIIKIVDATHVQLSGAAYTQRQKNSDRVAGSSRVDAIGDVYDLSVGMAVSGTGIPGGTTISSITPDPESLQGFASSGWITISQAATVDSGDILVFTAPASATLTFTPGPAEAGVDRPDIRFQYGEGTVGNLVDYDVQEQLPVNGVSVSGIAPTTPARADDSASQVKYDLFEDWVSLSDVSQQDTVTSRAYELLKPEPIRTFSVEVARAGPGSNAPDVPRIGWDFTVGDVVYLSIHDDATWFDNVPTLVSETTISPSDDDTGVDQKLVLGELAQEA